MPNGNVWGDASAAGVTYEVKLFADESPCLCEVIKMGTVHAKVIANFEDTHKHTFINTSCNSITCNIVIAFEHHLWAILQDVPLSSYINTNTL